VRHCDDEIRRRFDASRAEDIRARGITEKRLLPTLAAFQHSVDIRLHDHRIDPEFRVNAGE
jgi:hypothetical protein